MSKEAPAENATARVNEQSVSAPASETLSGRSGLSSVLAAWRGIFPFSTGSRGLDALLVVLLLGVASGVVFALWRVFSK